MLRFIPYVLGFIVAVLVWLKSSAIIFHLFVKLKDPFNASILSGYEYYLQYANNPTIIKKLTTAYTLPLLIIFVIILFVFKKKPQSIHGDAKLASYNDIKKTGLLDDNGIIVGKLRGKPLMMAGDYHIMVSAPTRGGKGVSIVNPVALSYPDSIVILDNKKELHHVTSGFRKQSGQEVYFFTPSPSDFKGDCWNPLFYISEDKYIRISDIQKISNFLMPTPQGTDPMWSSEARKLFDAIVLMLLDIKLYPISLGEIFRQVHTEQETSEYFEYMMEEYSEILDPLCLMGLRGFCDTPSRTRGGVLSSLKSALNMYANPLIDAVTEKNDFDLRDLRRKKMTIYVCILPADILMFSPLINLLFQQIIDLNTRTLPEHDPTLKHNCLLLMDEFTSIGKLQILSKAVGLMAGYGLQLMPIIQSPVQLQSVYKEDAKIFTKNMHLKVIFRPIDMEDATAIANEFGFITVTQTSKTGKKAQIFDKSQTISEIKRQLILPQEVKDLKPDECYLIHWQTNPIEAKRWFYYKDDIFKKRLLPPVEIPPVKVQRYPMRGSVKTLVDIKNVNSFAGIKENQIITDEQIDEIADKFLDAILEGGYKK